MFGPFRPSQPLLGGLLWYVNDDEALPMEYSQSVRKIPWRLSRPQKARQRARLRHVDKVIATLDNALQKQGLKMNSVERWKKEMPTEGEMLPKDKYTIFDRKEKRYRKGIHSKFPTLLYKCKA